MNNNNYQRDYFYCYSINLQHFLRTRNVPISMPIDGRDTCLNAPFPFFMFMYVKKALPEARMD